MHKLDGSTLAAVALCMTASVARVAFVARVLCAGVACASVVFVSVAFVSDSVSAHDDGRYASEPLHAWFDQLASGKGLCCSFADGFKVENVDWDTQEGRYRVRLEGEWVIVPDAAVVTEPNRYGPAVVWPYKDASGNTQIRCFMPGAGA